MVLKNFVSNNTMPLDGVGGAVLGGLVIWSLIWKGLALWRAARRGENVWFVALLILNTLGVLEIVYYFLITKTDKKEIKAL